LVVPTNVRAGRAAALYAIFQSAMGTPAADLTAAGATRLWTEETAIWAGPDVQVDAFMDADYGPKDDARYLGEDEPEGTLIVKGTEAALKWLLQSNFGAYAAGAFTLATGISATRWLTLAHVEDRFGAGTVTRRLVRIQDAWIPRLSLEWLGGRQKYLAIRAAYAGRKVLVQAQNAGGITFPVAPMQPSDKSIFPTANTTLDRDPAGANVSLRFRALRVGLDQGLGKFWDQGSGMFSVYKAGTLKAEIEFLADYSDESWAIFDPVRAGTPSRYRITSTAEDGTVLTINLYGVLLKIDPPGQSGQEYSVFRAKGIATEVGSDFVTIGLA